MTEQNKSFLEPEPHTRGVEDNKKRRPPKNLADAMIKALRPKQWVKNVLVLAAPAAAGTEAFFAPRTLVDILIAFVAFCLSASAIYLINDARDVEADRQHPTKRFRPIAAGVLPVNLAYGMAVFLMLAAAFISYFASSGHGLVIVVVVYIALQLGYCFGWKHQPVIDIALVSSGFMLRAMAGGVAAGINLSQWFLLVAAFGSLFMASGKRYAEILLAQKSGAKIRKSLEGYTPTYLRFVWTLSATAVVIAYSLWGFEMAASSSGTASVWYQISMVPFTVAILRYAADVDRGDGGAPDELALSDRALQVLAIAWVVCIGIAVYLVPAI
ncbi:decaprenyl-phosphate phosphoribosyltransferase [Corynebacterium pseudotuberculosis]|uniref:Decaprenyl-phosphate phosphoribosyltransferase n=2 Tax=Corynebacterium pseudotuberculosis TaxID=1719 RepID=D9QCX8_CORP2|nr:decaprenyl-phosphate phosphoribosyltransferase [Corynebacterium pseudotuberculosis]AER69951.1 4-hydroxybenzoate polyprenyltransferase-related prenyltransferase [Corynebacterium pseudotuberculosis 1/06-A]ADK29755.1 decaprenyl-phosphate phosphoribosyltransferase [Corynebacterium pseudotuberculosis FRC41]ADL11404.1 decaprenyl-phosphate phosphoribosyltransferase [Corynebacterium pseudotuberculosis C231]ADL21816.1 decaprenyl-phosphate phosphoribosyltransferase [Corynebacterium pseudotuberculosis 